MKCFVVLAYKVDTEGVPFAQVQWSHQGPSKGSTHGIRLATPTAPLVVHPVSFWNIAADEDRDRIRFYPREVYSIQMRPLSCVFSWWTALRKMQSINRPDFIQCNFLVHLQPADTQRQLKPFRESDSPLTAVIVRASLKSGLKQALKCFSVTILAAIIDVCVVG